MEIKFKVIVNIPAESVEALGISEDTLFKTSFENGRLVLTMLEDYDFEEDEDEFDDDFDQNCGDEECECGCDNCEHFCRHCGRCVLDD